jgi:hypothetical protein
VTGPEHYREGEKQLADATAQLEEGMWEEGRLTTALAQVHATLALAAATAMAATASLPPSDAVGWADACGTHAARLKTGAWEEKTNGD